MKKNKVITISILGLLFLVPFISLSRAQPPATSYVGLEVGDAYVWAHNIHLGASDEVWEQWLADNMTAHWSLPFDHISQWVDMGGVYGTATGKIGPTIPQYKYHYNVTSIGADIAGETQVNFSAGTEEPINFFTYGYNDTITIGEDGARFAEDCWYGGMATSVWWVGNNYDWTGSNSMYFAPKTIDWEEFAATCNTGLETMWAVSANYSFTLTVNATVTGFTMTSPVMGFGNNSEIITITNSYNADGVLIYYTFEYGSNILTEIVMEDIDNPVTTHPHDITIQEGYTGKEIRWTVTDASPDRYAVLQNGSSALSATPFYSGVQIIFDIPDGLAPGDYLYRINVVDYSENTAYDEVLLTVAPTPEQIIPGFDIILVFGFSTAAAIGIIYQLKKKK